MKWNGIEKNWNKFLSFQWIGTLTLFLFLTTLTFETQGLSSNSTCVSKKSCGECIRSPDCVWCSQPEFMNAANVPLDRCNTPTVHAAHPESIRCGALFLLSPKNEFNLTEDLAISKGSEYSQVVQIRPQRVNLKLRVGQAFDLNVQYAQAEDYPVDLYYLMDLSKSMEDDKETLSSMGESLARKMQELTSDFQLGFGSFVDKVVMPFVSTVEKNKLQPCPGCEAPYGFQNVMSLDQDTSLFAGEVQRAKVSGNLDAPEGGFDAIMQAVVCETIGWRDEARKLLVFSTDASFHYAGDGKLGGIVKPNDGLCHMDKGEYTHSTLQDYPSVAQINSKVKEKRINMIFAVTAEQVEIYKSLSASVEGSSCGELSANSSNVVELVSEEYQKITSSVEMKDTASEYIRVSYFSKCVGSNDMIETNKCNGLRVGTVVEFLVKIEVTRCPKNQNDWNQQFVIYQVGLHERVHIDLEMLCECGCEKPETWDYQLNLDYCNGTGTYKCGICECNENYFGRRCECSAKHGSTIDDDRACRLDNTTDIVCSNRGQCICGLCECEKRDMDDDQEISGTYCQCDNFSCERENGKLCSGRDHGVCECGKCTCNKDWNGTACACSTDKRTCTDPISSKICSGKGECVCGKCVCANTLTERYSGDFCEKCPNCPDRCEELLDCVQCTVWKSGNFPNEEDCTSNCTKYPEIVQVDLVNSEENNEKFCPATDAKDNCRFYYVYGYNSNRELYIKAQRTKDCPPEPPIFLIIFGVVGAIVLVGILFLVVWKLLTHIHDRAEYARFEKERMNAKWDAGENPIYKQATSTFKNPVYSGK